MRHVPAIAGLSVMLAPLAISYQTLAVPAREPTAIINGSPVDAEYLAAGLAEAAGAVVLEEAVLDAELARRMPNLPEGAEDAERGILMETLAAEAGVDASQAGPVLERLRAGRGLGPTRFAALLARNARLRALVVGHAASPEELELGVRMELGERVRARLIRLKTMGAAAEVLAMVRDAGEHGGEVFARLADERSEDARTRPGAVLPALSPDDVSLPAAVRRAMESTRAGLCAEVIVLEGGYGILWVDGRDPGVANPTAGQRSQAERRAHMRLDRLAMDRLGREILAQAKVTVFDDSLRWSWEHARR